MKPNSYIGAHVERREDLRFLRGAGEYVSDLTREDMLHAAILRSPVAHGVIRGIDLTAARDMPGVVAVFSAADIGTLPRIPMRQEPMPQLKPFEQPVIAESKVRYVGEPVAVVVADSAARAEDALAAIGLDIEELPPVMDRETALAGTSLLFEEVGTNVPASISSVRGDADAAFNAHKGYTRRERFSVQRHTAVIMEPRGLLAEWDGDHVTMSGAAKVPFHNKRILAKALGISEDNVTLIENDVGGGFGTRGEFYPEDYLIPFAARLTGRPVRWLEDRKENLLATNHARDAECELEIACEADGTIVAIRGRAIVDTGAYIRTVGVSPPRNIVQVLPGPYRVPNVHLEAVLTVSNKTPSGTYRGPGRFECDFFRERLFQMAANDLGIDPVEFRRKNLLTKAEIPWKLPTVLPFNMEAECDSGDYHETFERCLAEIGWNEKKKLQGRLIDGRHHGLAINCYIEGGAGGTRENARLTLERDGTVSLAIGSSAVGQGVETVFAQIAADAMEVPIERINPIAHGSTNLLKEGFGSFASRSIVMGGSAVVDASKKLRDAMRDAAAKGFDCAPGDVELSDGFARAAGKAISFGELAPLSADGTYGTSKRTYSYGAHAAHVTVDPQTGQVVLLEYAAVEDVGRIINPHTLHGQTMGAIVQGLGGALLEDLVYDADGQPLAASLADYLMPTASDFPHIHVVALENHPAPGNPLGAKGAGEGGIIPVGAVVANAVAAALADFGVEPNHLPLTPPKLWRMLQDKKQPSP